MSNGVADWAKRLGLSPEQTRKLASAYGAAQHHDHHAPTADQAAVARMAARWIGEAADAAAVNDPQRASVRDVILSDKRSWDSLAHQLHQLEHEHSGAVYLEGHELVLAPQQRDGLRRIAKRFGVEPSYPLKAYLRTVMPAELPGLTTEQRDFLTAIEAAGLRSTLDRIGEAVTARNPRAVAQYVTNTQQYLREQAA